VNVRDATPEELAAWDQRTVEVPGGHVYQSRAWATHRAGSGWSPRFLMTDDGAAALALLRPWPLLGGSSAYLPRGPVPLGEPAADAVARLVTVTDRLAEDGVDVLATDAEVEAATGYGEALRAAGFQAMPEIQPSRHRMSLPLPAGTDDDTVMHGITKSTRQRIHGAEKTALRIVRHDTAGWAGDDTLFAAPDGPPDAAFETFYGLLGETGERRGFSLGAGGRFVPWWRLAHDAGHLVYLEARDGDATIGGLILYRHGRRLSTVHSADTADARTTHPGVMHLLRWRAIQLAIREGRDEMDLGGVDTGPAHQLPAAGEPLHGLYEHKRGFGAVWVEMAGAHERVIHPARYGLGRVLTRAARVVGR